MGERMRSFENSPERGSSGGGADLSAQDYRCALALQLFRDTYNRRVSDSSQIPENIWKIVLMQADRLAEKGRRDSGNRRVR